MVCFFLLLVNRCGCKDNKKNVITTLFREKFLKKCVFNKKGAWKNNFGGSSAKKRGSSAK